MADIQNEVPIEDLINENYQPSRKEMLEFLETSDMDEEMKENLRNMLTGDLPQLFGGGGAYLAIGFVAIMFSIILFFGYKLYKSIKDKRVKLEEKKKLKQMKKKK
ncbi:uncharacterized protein LOC112045954 isoform X1 [Bicyclus anynana]|uniref:Uncharacterized protein LOC112045954 isoform X1 n=1 Tax=Bicyclus anynana TaxID=110368 RepID=A0A6J1MUB9_BICAN|nr:uncharacterized protein LOC112045954 isoform X1 [Bicyclus anynana]